MENTGVFVNFAVAAAGDGQDEPGGWRAAPKVIAKEIKGGIYS
jgi:hypothetical protein